MAPDRSAVLAAVLWMFLALTWVAVSLRCYVRAIMTKSFGSDDWLAVGSLMIFTTYCVVVLLGVGHGTGKHLFGLSIENIILAFKYWWVGEIMYVLSTTVCKASIAVFLLRICRQKSHIYVIWTVMTVVLIYSTFYVLLIIFQCQPVSYFWMRFAGAGGKCIPTSLVANTTYAHSAVSIISDWTLGTLPIFIVWNLNMNPRTKISVALILALGALGSTATVVRIPYIYQLTNTFDFLFATVDVVVWSTVEPGIGITCAALACCRPLFQTFFSHSRLWGSSSGRAGTGGWPAQGPHHVGYVKNGSKHRIAAAFLPETNINTKNSVITTTVQSRMGDRDDSEHDIELGEAGRTRGGLHRSASERSLKGGMGWDMSENKVADYSSEDYDAARKKLRIGVKTTTKVTILPAPVVEKSSNEGGRG